jgi:Domain of unknown function (DUF2703)
MKIEFLYFKDCPGYKPALSLLEQLIEENNIDVSIEKIEITTQELALQHRFLGSPSIRINGKDIEGREESSDYGLKCRIYSDGSGVLSEATLRKALQANRQRA